MAELLDRLKVLGERAKKLKDQLQTEEATKHSLILPFIVEMGYDVYDPNQVVPEFTADFGTKKGEKIDYAILKDNQPVIIIECKHCTEDLSKHGSQLFRYFATLPAKFAILTNGINYMFFSDIEEANKLDEKPFFEFNICEISDYQIEQLKRFHKNQLNVDEVAGVASELKYLKEMISFLKTELTAPSDGFIEYISKNISDVRLTQKRLNILAPLAKKAVKQVADDLFKERIDRVLDIKKEEEPPAVQEEKEPAEGVSILTTQDELDAFYVVKAITRKDIEHNRIQYKDYHSFFGIRIDNMQSKTFCKLYFNNSKKKSIIFINKDKTEESFDIENIENIYEYADALIKCAKSFAE